MRVRRTRYNCCNVRAPQSGRNDSTKTRVTRERQRNNDHLFLTLSVSLGSRSFGINQCDSSPGYVTEFTVRLSILSLETAYVSVSRALQWPCNIYKGPTYIKSPQQFEPTLKARENPGLREVKCADEFSEAEIPVVAASLSRDDDVGFCVVSGSETLSRLRSQSRSVGRRGPPVNPGPHFLVENTPSLRLSLTSCRKPPGIDLDFARRTRPIPAGIAW